MRRIYYLVFILAMAIQVRAQWELCKGPFGGLAYCIASYTDSSGITKIFAGGENGVYLSADNGSKWKNVSLVTSSPYFIYTLAVLGSTVFASTNDGTILTSDNGKSWKRTSLKTAHDFAVCGKNIFANFESLVYISADTGRIWELAGPVSPPEVSTMAALGSNLIAGTYNNGIYLSTNNGTSWTQINSGLPEWTKVYDFAVKGVEIFAGAMQGIYHSTDSGASWVRADSGIPRDQNGWSYIQALCISGKNIYAGVSHTYSLQRGLYLSTDNGISWEDASRGLPQQIFIHDLTACGKYVFAGTADGIYRTANEEVNWVEADSGLINTSIINTLVFNGSNLYAGGGAWGAGLRRGERGVFLSTDYGDSWTEVGNELRGNTITALAFFGTKLFAGGIDFNDFIVGHTVLAYYDGSSWIQADSGLPKVSNSVDSYLNALEVMGKNIFAGISPLGETGPSGIYISQDPGRSWANYSTGLPQNLHIYDLAAYGEDIFAGTDNGIYISPDSNASWKAALLPHGSVRSFAVCDSHLFAGTSEGVYLYDYKGRKWNPANYGLPIPSNFYSTPILAASRNKIFAGYTTNEVYLSTDYGKSWEDFSSGFLFGQIQSLAADDNYLFAGSFQTGIWKRKLSEAPADVKSTLEAPLKFSLEQNYPNPFNPTTTIKFSLPYSSHVTLKIYDLLGREIAILVNEEKSAGNHNAVWKADNHASGVYFFELRAGSFTEKRKMMLIR